MPRDASNGVRYLQAKELEAFITRALSAVGLPAQDGEQIARWMTLAGLRRADGHGIFCLPQYVRRIHAGGINVQPQIRVIRATEAAELADGDNGMGHLVMRFAAGLAMDKAERQDRHPDQRSLVAPARTSCFRHRNSAVRLTTLPHIEIRGQRVPGRIRSAC